MKVNGDIVGIKSFLTLSVSALMAIGGISFKLVLDRMDKQEAAAAASITALRDEIKATKEAAKEQVAAAAAALRDKADSVDARVTRAEEKIWERERGGLTR